MELEIVQIYWIITIDQLINVTSYLKRDRLHSQHRIQLESYHKLLKYEKGNPTNVDMSMGGLRDVINTAIDNQWIRGGGDLV